ncbi:uncharacterized protein LOC122525321 [Polistes fuscatus]|uniref:uncharacterized protein LOC122525321 n=1 Tax=Polistes fuscatus TaxID=30207 RepID=UPI001CA854A7|nr:uncharacterized protein LOC122525321 [Polistes fuscatus]
MRIFYVRFLFFISGCTGISRSETREYEKTRSFLREKRHLLFPDPKESETKVQVLFGLGLPMEEDISMTLGYVLKCNYDLPYNSSDFTRAHARFKKFTDNVLPQGEKPEHRGLSRWTLYRMLESTMERFGSGKACLLRAVCESASNPFEKGRGLLGELLHVLLTPSTTFEEYEIYSDREYFAAEAIGRNSNGKCGYFYTECQYNPLDYFTTIGDMFFVHERP